MLSMRKETDYAIQLLKKLAGKKQPYLSLQKVSEEIGVSFLFLQKIARKLRQGKIIEAEQGIKGGYKLLVSPAKLPLRRVIETMEGKCGILSCLKSDCACGCMPGKTCTMKNSKKLARLNKNILGLLDKIKLADL